MAGETPPEGAPRHVIGRRTLVGAAWATPVVLATTAAPAYAASCPTFVFPAMPSSGTSGNGWTRSISPANGMQGTNTNSFIAGPGYSLVDDPRSLFTVTVTISVLVALRNDRSYTFVWTYNKYGGNPRQLTCDFQIDGVSQASGFMDSDVGPNYTDLTKSATYAPATAKNYTIAYVFTFPASLSTTGDDMQVYSPVVTCG